jgi:hypothetical protein
MTQATNLRDRVVLHSQGEDNTMDGGLIEISNMIGQEWLC